MKTSEKIKWCCMSVEHSLPCNSERASELLRRFRLWGCTVPIYRFYIFEKDDLVAAPPKIYDLPSDAAALEAARTINGHAVEVWCKKRKIGRLNPHDQPSSEADHRQARGLPRNGLHP